MSDNVRIVSFGYLHGEPIGTMTPDLTLDVRRSLRDPARVRDAGLLDATGLDTPVRDMVATTPGADTALLVMRLFVLRHVELGKPVTVAVGCAGGRHRSVALAELLSDDLLNVGIPVVVTHLHVHLPRVLRTEVEEEGR